jgi:hypothetical protein
MAAERSSGQDNGEGADCSAQAVGAALETIAIPMQVM